MKTWVKAVLVVFAMSYASLAYSSAVMHVEYTKLKSDKNRHDKAFLGIAVAHTECIESKYVIERSNRELSVSRIIISSKLKLAEQRLLTINAKIDNVLAHSEDLRREHSDLLISYEALHEELVKKNKQLEALKGQ